MDTTATTTIPSDPSPTDYNTIRAAVEQQYGAELGDRMDDRMVGEVVWEAYGMAPDRDVVTPVDLQDHLPHVNMSEAARETIERTHDPMPDRIDLRGEAGRIVNRILSEDAPEPARDVLITQFTGWLYDRIYAMDAERRYSIAGIELAE